MALVKDCRSVLWWFFEELFYDQRWQNTFMFLACLGLLFMGALPMVGELS